MSERIDRAAEKVYRGLWDLLAGWFYVPRSPPTLPAGPGERIEAFKPSPDYLRYVKFWFWLGLTAIDVAILVGWIVLAVVFPLVGILFSPLFFALAVVPDVIAYIAIHLRYDTTWFVLGTRSLRIRRGIWIIHETTITYENIQNVTVHQGPVQRREPVRP